MMSRALPATSEEAAGARATSRRNRESCFDAPPLLLPFSRCPEPNVPLKMTSVRVPLSGETAERIQSLASDPTVVFLAAWYILLWRFTDQSEVLVGYVADGCETNPGLRTVPLILSV